MPLQTLRESSVVILVVIRSRIRSEASEEYAALATQMRALATVQPGFLSVKSYYSEDGEKVTLHEWESEEHLRAWREHPEHLEVQQRGRDVLLEDYTVFACNEPRISQFSG
jgi:heme-degrading monooxygenase HmoA